jgi:hypothetical protein
MRTMKLFFMPSIIGTHFYNKGERIAAIVVVGVVGWERELEMAVVGGGGEGSIGGWFGRGWRCGSREKGGGAELELGLDEDTDAEEETYPMGETGGDLNTEPDK